MNQKYILGIAVLVWGVQSGLIWFALPMAVILEARYHVNRRWALVQKDFYRVADLTTLGMAGVIAFLFLNSSEYHFIKLLMQWLPIVFYGLVVVIDYSTTDRMRLDVLFYSLRRQKQPVTQSWNVDYVYFGLCLLSTGIEVDGSLFYFPYVVGMICWALYPLRQRRYRASVWLLLASLTFLSADLVHQLLSHGQNVLEEKSKQWITNWMMQHRDPLKTRTSLGTVGRMKLSDSILFRIKPEGGRGFPTLIREASYDLPYVDGTAWETLNTGFKNVPHSDDFAWRFTEPSPIERSAVFYLEFDRERALVPVPEGIAEISDLAAIQVKKNRYGAIQASELVASPLYNIRYQPGHSIASGPLTTTPDVPKRFQSTLARITPRITMPPDQAITFVQGFFSDFRYSLYQRNPNTLEDPLGTFLFEEKAGHCEYFASATALLLRQLGVHSRYVVGFSVQEYDDSLEMYIVRQRHAHAWAEAFVDDRWIPVDTTPAIWLAEENASAGLLRPLIDSLDNATFVLKIWWHQVELATIVVILALFLIWRIYTSEQVIIEDDANPDTVARTFPGMESPFYRIERYLQSLGHMRSPAELSTAYLHRIRYEELLPLLRTHHRWRFDPRGVSDADKSSLTSAVDAWLSRHPEGTS